MTIDFIRAAATSDFVGESPFWDDSGFLYWVDIVGREVRRLDASSGVVETRTVDNYPTAIALFRDRSAAILSKGLEIGRFDFDSGAFEPIVAVESGNGASMRLNEGKCDPAGRFWVATMDNNLNPDGSPREMQGARGHLFCLDGEVTKGPFVQDLNIPNTMAWAPSGDVFYFGDTIRNVLWAFDYDRASGTVSNQRVFAEGGPGLPDGSGIDAQGYLWNARFSAGCLMRFAPDGHLDRTIELPVRNPTACTFGGKDLKTLYVTSGRFGLDNPGALDGALLSAQVEVPGGRENYYAG
ncbi:sugar lactone lactonase YvrE [Devosia subaequoris]|uniref:Sugar lactone lactonase YvrE n=1 Tax=Devosia subaequoris TaxID=395930 RepID=A0A7W6IQV6_9HYPH|nr:SMP-30/gluconolactonase/LRE family protein [Devosia subaequoris]MBB4054004.1 sugar lactone lactonase YvrE [Devosia subaequoris]MCP1211521.1 SMP-30/gluconolactonase/LRE family protein [Devosia subaequoris]